MCQKERCQKRVSLVLGCSLESTVRRRKECFTSLQSGHVLCLSVLFRAVVVNSISHRKSELVLCITKCCNLKIVHVYEQITSPSEEDINNFYNDMDAILGKPSHYGIVVGDIYAQVGIRTNPVETVTVKCGFQMK